MRKINNYFQWFVQREENAAELFSQTFPVEIRKLLRISSLERRPSQFITVYLDSVEADFLFSFSHRTKNKKIYTLIEARSFLDPEIFRQLSKEMKEAQEDHPQDLIIPIIFYHGKADWSLMDNLPEHKKWPIASAMTEGLELNFQPIVINLQELPEPSPDVSALVRSFLKVIVHHHLDDQYDALQDILLEFHDAPEKERELKNYGTILNYFSLVTDIDLRKLLREIEWKLPAEFRRVT